MNLENFPFYKELEPQAKNFLQMHLKPVSVPKDSILFFQGDICDGILFLTSGEVRLYIQSDNADEITLYHLNPGEQCIVNTASTLSQTEAIGSAVTLCDVEGYILDMHSVKELAHNSDVYQRYLFSIYTLRMGNLIKLINDIKFKNLDQRIIDWLQNKNEKEIKTTHEAIANELGSTREVISKILKSLENDGMVKLGRGSITLM
ncbi:Crp/Fnr family transcriptional regulator [Sulfurimonas autotrophica]|uniref:Transcriptional regulator, Crp/Fnr family n=1 Tax=Sulfurimonas autotrophica (strain ATCC BAA-671 / DSM 16294 / JCM 11897 / OK10) TaxID=563040 RepID=E0UP44_SULAO|nr:Crp/Fnr family transcriptional regulator [Sulfurimonas autotrophica]ADN08077.1 transcriptional regulator, Crp/Fnr family [Sulfurimonas autotrophica DSM 16294]